MSCFELRLKSAPCGLTVHSLAKSEQEFASGTQDVVYRNSSSRGHGPVQTGRENMCALLGDSDRAG